MVYQCMPSPYLHPRLKTYYFRKHVPAALREAVGKTVIQIRLLDQNGQPIRTPALAKRFYGEAAARAEAILAKAEGGPVRLTDVQTVGLVGKWYPGQLAKDTAQPPTAHEIGAELDLIGGSTNRPDGWRLYESVALDLLAGEGLKVDQPSLERLSWEVLSRRGSMLRTLQMRAAGDPLLRLCG
jgi:hypothetical protein